jgi:tetratricopeptide (TPR) repeat protein
MKKFLFLLLSFAPAFPLVAQTVGGEPVSVIEYRLSDDSTLFSRLSGRLINGDTTLTINELNILYYGSVFQKNYNPYLEERIIDAGSALARRGKTDDALRLFDNLLSKNPACLPAWLEKAYTLYTSGDSLQTDPVYRRYALLLQAPMRSGNGNSVETAFVVRSVMDEELILNELGLVAVGQTLITRNGQSYHVAFCKKEDGKTQEQDVYFNVELPLKKGLQRNLKQK